MTADALPFDSIVLVEGDRERKLTADELAQMGMHDRVSAILESRLRFYRRGAEVDVMVALKALRNLSSK
jgi:hypothetical protein